MTSSTSLPRHAHRRGTRGFAAFVTLLAGFVVLGVGAVVLPNPRGTAPGQALEADGRLLVLLPGPPGEMAPTRWADHR